MGKGASSNEALVFVNPQDQARVTTALKGYGLTPKTLGDPGQFPKGLVGAVVLDPDLFGANPAAAASKAVARLEESPLIFLSGPRKREDIAELIGVPGTTAIIPRDHFSSDNELRYAIRCVARGPNFGFEGIFGSNVATMEMAITGSGDRDAALDEIGAFFKSRGVRRRLNAMLQDVAEELITNAVYDAPVDQSGQQIYAAYDRRRAVVLPAGKHATLKMAWDPEKAAVAIGDPHGSLVARTCRRFLSKGLRGGPDQIDTKQGGAGLGLTRIYQMVDHLSLRMVPGTRTEVMAMFEIGGGRKDMAARPTSLIIAQAAP